MFPARFPPRHPSPLVPASDRRLRIAALSGSTPASRYLPPPATAGPGLGPERSNARELPFGFPHDMADVLPQADIAFECFATDRGRDGFRAGQIKIGNDDLGRTGAMKDLAERAADAVGAARDNHDSACDLHWQNPLVKKVFRPEPDRARRCNGRPPPAARSNATTPSRSEAPASPQTPHPT